MGFIYHLNGLFLAILLAVFVTLCHAQSPFYSAKTYSVGPNHIGTKVSVINGKVHLTWKQPTRFGADIMVVQKAVGQSKFFKVYSSNVNEWQDDDIQVGHNYRYRVTSASNGNRPLSSHYVHIGDDYRSESLMVNNGESCISLPNYLNKPLPQITINDLASVQNLCIKDSQSDTELSAADINRMLGVFTSIKKLDIHVRHINLEELTVLRQMTGLVSLGIYGNKVDGLAALQWLPQLTRLDIPGNSISDLSEFKVLTNLRHLNLEKNHEISSISPLSYLKHLRYLNLSHNTIRDIAPLAELKHLRQLNLAGNHISTIDALSGLLELRHLNIGRNQIRSLNGIQHLKNIEWLSANHNRIGSIAPLHGLNQLQWLFLDHNSIDDIDPIASCPQLMHASFNQNEVWDISPLVQLPIQATTKVVLSNNPVELLLVHTNKSALQTLKQRHQLVVCFTLGCV